MRNNFLFFSFLFIFNLSLFSQNPGQWTWMKGTDTTNSFGIFGTKGISAPSNNPPGLYEAYEWTDKDGNFWVFGGVSNIPHDSNYSIHNALWKFDPLTNNWTWMNGDSIPFSSGIYGVQGIPSPNNTPGPRGWGGITWVDAAGDLWLFGGTGRGVFSIGRLNDLWRYNIATNMWTWMKGSQSPSNIPIKGTIGVASSNNTPDGRTELSDGVADNLGNLWFFGGIGGFNARAYNDIWKYNILTNMWTWVAGNQNQNNIPNYGLLNVESASNNPGDRHTYTKFIDSKNNFYFMGSGLSSINQNVVIDVWKFNTTTLMWTWVGGSNILNESGLYNLKCDINTLNKPKARIETRASWADSCGFFFFGGLKFEGLYFDYQDLWYYNVESNKFTWVSGTSNTNNAGFYGTKGVSSPSNLPSTRCGALAFRDRKANLWLFGGAKGFFDKISDLWKYELDTNCINLCSKSIYNPAFKVQFNANNLCGLAPITIQFNNLSISATSYTWNFGDGSPISTSMNPLHTYTNNGIYSISLTAQGTGTNLGTSMKTSYIYIGSQPSATFTTILKDTQCLYTPFVFNNLSADSIVASVWQFGDGQSSNSFNTSHYYQSQGNYTVNLSVTDNHNCKSIFEKQITVLSVPNSSFGMSLNYGCEPLTVNFINTSVNANSFFWNLGNNLNSALTNPSTTYTANGIYTVTLISDSADCKDTLSKNITVYPLPNSNFSIIKKDSCFPYFAKAKNNSVVLTNSYRWNVDGVISLNNDSVIIGPIGFNTSMFIKLITTTGNGCKDSISQSVNFTGKTCDITPPFIPITDFFIPEIITPNGDNKNETFFIRGLENYPNNFLQIFNRWGNLIYSSKSYKNDWDGTPNAKGSGDGKLPSGTYYYLLELNDEAKSVYKGFVQLVY